MRGPRRGHDARCCQGSDGGRIDGLSAGSLLRPGQTCQEPQTEPVRLAQASVAFGASYVNLRRIKCVLMPRGAASEVACGRISEMYLFLYSEATEKSHFFVDTDDTREP
jgi:hypothetical protein